MSAETFLYSFIELGRGRYIWASSCSLLHAYGLWMSMHQAGKRTNVEGVPFRVLDCEYLLIQSCVCFLGRLFLIVCTTAFLPFDCKTAIPAKT